MPSEKNLVLNDLLNQAFLNLLEKKSTPEESKNLVNAILNYINEENLLRKEEKDEIDINNLEVSKKVGNNTKTTTLLIQAVISGDLNLMTFLMEAGASVNKADKTGNKPLTAAVEHGYKNIEDYRNISNHLLGKFEKKSLKDIFKTHTNVFGSSLFHQGAFNDVMPLVKNIIDFILKNCTPEEKQEISNEIENQMNLGNKHGETPLHKAAERGNVNAVEFLVGEGAKTILVVPKGSFHYGRNAYQIATWKGHSGVIEFLGKHPKAPKGNDGIKPGSVTFAQSFYPNNENIPVVASHSHDVSQSP